MEKGKDDATGGDDDDADNRWMKTRMKMPSSENTARNERHNRNNGRDDEMKGCEITTNTQGG